MRYTEIIAPIRLDEVTMSPSNLRSEAKKIGATAGMEFEMIVPNVSTEDEEEDFDQDERARSFREIMNFFNDGDQNSRRDVDRMIEGLREGFWDYASEIVSDRFYSREGRRYFEEYIEDEFDEDSARETAEEEISEANPDLDPDDSEYTDLVDNRIEELKKEWFDEEWDNQGRLFERARDDFEQGEYDSIDEDDYLNNQGWRYMSDIPYRDYDVYWPHMTSGGENSADDAAESFSDAIGRKVNVSGSYHGVRNEGEYTVEPDGSLDPDDSNDAGLEFVSPPLPLDQMLIDLNKIVAWAKEYGCYTNDSTGLHMNVSVPNFSRENLDYVKLALLLGDEYVLNQFGRITNTYAGSALRKVKQIISDSPQKAGDALDMMKTTLTREAARIIHSGTTQKYTSINTKTGYIEFRSPGGDWLEEDIQKLENTLLRFVVALDAACDPEKYKQEYQKKFYKILEPSRDEYGTMIKDFGDYVTGVGGAPESIVKAFRRSAIATLQQSNAAKRNKSGVADTIGKSFWELYDPRGLLVARFDDVLRNEVKAQLEAWRYLKRQNPDFTMDEFDEYKVQPIKVANTQGDGTSRWNILNAAGNPVGQVSARTQAGADIMAQRYLRSLNPNLNTTEFSVRRAEQ